MFGEGFQDKPITRHSDEKKYLRKQKYGFTKWCFRFQIQKACKLAISLIFVRVKFGVGLV